MKIENLVSRELYVMSGYKHAVEITVDPWPHRGGWAAYGFTYDGKAFFVFGNKPCRKATMKEQRDFWHKAYLNLQKSTDYLNKGMDQFLEAEKLNAIMKARWMAVKQKTKKVMIEGKGYPVKGKKK